MDPQNMGVKNRILRLRVLTFNIHNGINWYGRYNLERIIAFIREVQPDLAGLQEVSRFWSIQTRFHDQVGLLADSLGMFPAYSVSLQRKQAYFGNLILSKYPIINSWSELLPGRLERRSYIAAQIMVGGVKINFLTTHLGLSVTDRLEQAERIIRFAARLGPLIITGDFNGGPEDPSVSMFLERWRRVRPTEDTARGTFRSQNGRPGPELDLILVTSDFSLDRTQVLDNFLSDHLPVLAELKLSVPWWAVAGEPVYI